MNQHAAILDLLRHGETTAGKCFLGSTDAALTEHGWQQMRNAVTEPALYERVVTSPLLRCIAFARDYAQEHGLPLHIEQDLREIHFGAWEGRTSAQLWQSEQQALLDFWEDPYAHTPPEAESMASFVRRVSLCHERLQRQFQQQNILLVAHAGVIKVMLCSVLGMHPRHMQRLSIDHGGLSRILQSASPQVAFFNRLKS